jgi:hypothetical protein
MGAGSSSNKHTIRAEQLTITTRAHHDELLPKTNRRLIAEYFTQKSCYFFGTSLIFAVPGKRNKSYNADRLFAQVEAQGRSLGALSSVLTYEFCEVKHPESQ